MIGPDLQIEQTGGPARGRASAPWVSTATVSTLDRDAAERLLAAHGWQRVDGWESGDDGTMSTTVAPT